MRVITFFLYIVYSNRYNTMSLTFCIAPYFLHKINSNEKIGGNMNFSKEDYKKFVKAHAKRSPILKNCVWAFCVGGTICAFAEGLKLTFTHFGASLETAGTLVSVTLIFLAAVFTGLGYFDLLAKRAGAGTLVPITGFANSVVSPAIDTKAEGWVLGVGAKIFTIAGPVILYGTLSSVIYGVIYAGIKMTAG